MHMYVFTYVHMYKRQRENIERSCALNYDLVYTSVGHFFEYLPDQS